MNKIILFTIIFSVLLFQFVLNADNYFTDIQFTDQNTGWLFTRGLHLYKTENGGISWYSIKTPASGKFFVINRDSILILSGNKTLWFTADGGQSWDRTHFPDYHLLSVYFINADIGFLSGQDEEYLDLILRTEDGGQNWYKASFDSIYNSAIVEVEFYNKKIGYGIGFERIYRTEDGGKNWQLRSFITYATTGGVQSATVLDSNIIVINQWEPHVFAEGFLRISWDGGKNWSDYGKRKYFEFGITDHWFLSENICWVICDDGHDIYKTTNHGRTWVPHDLPVKKLYFLSWTKAWGISDDQLYYTEDGWLTYTTCDSLLTNVNSTALYPDHYILNQNRPNPFNAVTAISYYLPEESFVKLSVFDLRGREVAVLVNQEQSPGTYQIHFDASGFGSGIYTVRLFSNEVSVSRKMVLLK
jgi:photosystem II stability/assembly factor-like uncharacterized protein